MKTILRNILPVGFAFGMFFSIMAYTSNTITEPLWLWLIPFMTALLCVLGGGLASAVVVFLNSRYSLPGATTITIAFATAAVFNVLVVSLTATYFGIVVLQLRMLLGVIPGLGLGAAAYAAYHYHVDTLNERVLFFKALADKNKQLQDAARRLAITEERNRMGRELHDSVSQGLHGLVFAVHSLRNTLESPSEQVLNILGHMETTASSTLDELRAMIEELKPSLLTEQGLHEALRATGDLFSQHYKVPFQISVDIVQAIPPELELTMYRVAQEGLTNIGRHASAQHVHLKVSSHSDRVLLIISDDGIGLDTNTPAAGNGLANMRHRIQEQGGTFKLSSKPGLGTIISAEFPSKG